MSETEFDWSPLGPTFWSEAAKTTDASERQAKLACGLHAGKTKALSARLAGYGGDDASIRQTGARMAKSDTVQNLLALAVAQAGGGDDGIVGTAEARRILSRLARGSDPSVRIKALESLNRLETAERDRRSGPEDDGFSVWRFARDLVDDSSGRGYGGRAAAYCLAHFCGPPDNWPLLHDVHAAVMRENPAAWDELAQIGNDDAQARLRKFLADLSWQRDARRTLWRELGKTPPGPIAMNGADPIGQPIPADPEKAAHA
jgi:hypothetical protein